MVRVRVRVSSDVQVRLGSPRPAAGSRNLKPEPEAAKSPSRPKPAQALGSGHGLEHVIGHIQGSCKMSPMLLGNVCFGQFSSSSVRIHLKGHIKVKNECSKNYYQ